MIFAKLPMMTSIEVMPLANRWVTIEVRDHRIYPDDDPRQAWNLQSHSIMLDKEQAQRLLKDLEHIVKNCLD